MGAFPLRKYAIIDRKLQFPSGTATATVIRTMHANASEAYESLKRLLTWTGVTTCQELAIYFLNDGAATSLSFWPGSAKFGIAFDWSLSSCAIGMILPNCINASILAGGVIAFCAIKPWIEANHQCDFGVQEDKCWFNLQEERTYAASYLESRAYWFYPGVAMVVVDGFYSIAKLTYLLVKSFVKPDEVQQVDDESDPSKAARERRLQEIFLGSKLPAPLMAGGYLTCSAVCVVLVGLVFRVPLYQVLIAVVLTPIFSVGIIVGVGMTDWDVSSSFGKLMMIPFGAMAASQHSVIPALAACVTTIAGCGAAANLMQDFKTGYLLGAKPKTMFKAQIIGAVAGCFIAPAMFQIFNSAYTLP